MNEIDKELARLEPDRWPSLPQPETFEAKMWKRSYLIAAHANEVLRARIAKLIAAQP